MCFSSRIGSDGKMRNGTLNHGFVFRVRDGHSARDVEVSAVCVYDALANDLSDAVFIDDQRNFLRCHPGASRFLSSSSNGVAGMFGLFCVAFAISSIVVQ
jgi:hypothetical protein